MHIENFSKSAAFFAKLQIPNGGVEEGGMMEAEDNDYDNTDNTLEAIWVWSRYYELTGDNQYFTNISKAWNYSNASGHKPWAEMDSGKVYSCAWALRAEMKFREAYNNWSYSFFADFSAERIIVMNAWEPSIGFDFITKMLIKGWGAGNLYEYGISVGNDTFRIMAMRYGNETMDNVTADPTLLSSEGWALAGGALMWGIVHSSMQEYPNVTWIEANAPYLKTSVPNPGAGPGNSQNGWEAWYAFGHKAAYDISGNITYYLNFMNITENLILRDGDDDGGIPTNIGDPDDTDESWVTSYRAFFCLEPFNELGSSVPPTAPSILSTDLTGINDENVTLIWSLSPDADVILYEIYYGANYSPKGSGYKLLGAVFNTTSTYTHINPPSTYFYAVTARDMEGWRNSSSNQGVRFNMNLSPGRNLISIPLPLSSNVPSAIFQGVIYDAIWYYNATDTIDHWKLYNKFKANNDLTYIDSTMALWINITQESNFTIAGVVPQSADIQLYGGWNLVAYPSFMNRTVGEALAGMDYERVECYVPSPPENLKLCPDSDYMMPGYGYWIKLSTDAMWTLTNA